MLDRTATAVTLDHQHCRAICEEIGDRLRHELRRRVPETPRRLLALIEKLALQEQGDLVRWQPSPSIVPSTDEMAGAVVLALPAALSDMG